MFRTSVTLPESSSILSKVSYSEVSFERLESLFSLFFMENLDPFLLSFKVRNLESILAPKVEGFESWLLVLYPNPLISL